MQLFNKIKGDTSARPPRAGHQAILLGFLGGITAIGLLSLITQLTETALLLGSFGASCVLLFGFPDAPFSQPRHVIFGHLICTTIGLAFISVLGYEWWVVALAAGTSIAAMMATNTVHPPAGSNPVIVYLIHPAWSFVLYPTLLGAVLLVMVALIFNNLTRKTAYPKYW